EAAEPAAHEPAESGPTVVAGTTMAAATLRTAAGAAGAAIAHHRVAVAGTPFGIDAVGCAREGMLGVVEAERNGLECGAEGVELRAADRFAASDGEADREEEWDDALHANLLVMVGSVRLSVRSPLSFRRHTKPARPLSAALVETVGPGQPRGEPGAQHANGLAHL